MRVLTYCFRICLLVVFSTILFSSCENEVIIKDNNSSVEEVAELRGAKNECILDADDLQANIQWAEDCSSVTLTLSLCCDCFAQTGQKKPCTIYPADLYLYVQYTPSKFQEFNHTIGGIGSNDGISVKSGSCSNMQFVIDDNPRAFFINDFTYNGVDVDLDTSGLDEECPYL